jgi:hypothetical protein
MSHSKELSQLWLTLAAAVAVLVGVFARFKGLGAAPFAVDEYYLSQSIANVLHHGIPAFDCGGYYMRGVLLQYLAAAEQRAGLSAELAPRLICAASGLLALPAAYLLGRRVHGRGVATLTVIILAVSVWEIEMARFGRMYAPFQTVFLWYVVFFVRYTVDRDLKALWPMLALSIAGPLVWEGGVFLTLANLLPVFLQQPSNRIVGRPWPYLIGCSALLLLAVWFVTSDFRGMADPSWPPGYTPSLSRDTPDPVTTLKAPIEQILHHPAWLATAAIPLLLVALALRWVWGLRSRPLLALGLLCLLAAAAVHQFLLAGALGLLLLLSHLVGWRELFGASARPLHLALLACLLFWLAFGVVITDWGGAHIGELARGGAKLGYQLLRFPDFVGVVVRPWARAIPHLGAALLLLSAIAMYRMARSDKPLDAERALLVLFLIMLLAASASHPPRQETRYVFNLYPLAIIFALTTLARGAEFLTTRPAMAAGLTTVVALGGFALSEDFRPGHLLRIDSPAVTFRIGLPQDVQSHLVIRDDHRTLARWLQQNVPGDAVVINGVHGFDHYYRGINYFYVNLRDPNFPQWSCRRGTVERWGNYPLLYSSNALSTAIGTKPAYLITFGYDSERLLKSLAALHPRVAMTQGEIIVVELRG